MKGHAFVFCILLFSCPFSDGSDLGPKDDDNDLGPKDGYCVTESCVENFQNYPNSEDDENEKKDLKDRGQTSPSIFTSSWNAFKNVGKAAFNTVYKLSEDVLSDIEELFRTVFNEEAYNMVSTVTQKALSNIFDQDNILTGVGKTVLSVSILIAVLFFNYMLSNYISILVLLAFDGALFLLHGYYGPVFIGNCFITICGMVYELLKLTISYPYFSSASFLGAFVFSCCIWPCCLRSRFKYLKTSDERLYNMDERFYQLERTLEDWISESSKRSERMQLQLNRIEDLLTKIKYEGKVMNSEP